MPPFRWPPGITKRRTDRFGTWVPWLRTFYAAFHLGGSDTTITTVDPDGLALAAIQGLNQKVEARTENTEARIKKVEAENAELKMRLESWSGC